MATNIFFLRLLQFSCKSISDLLRHRIAFRVVLSPQGPNYVVHRYTDSFRIPFFSKAIDLNGAPFNETKWTRNGFPDNAIQGESTREVQMLALKTTSTRMKSFLL